MRAAAHAVALGALTAICLLHAAPAGATVPMDPQFLPEAGLLLAAVFAGAIALYLLFTLQVSRAMRAGAVSLACIVLAFVLARTLHKPSRPPGLLPGTANSMSLVLGNVVLRVAPSDRYVFSVNDKHFLDLDLQRSELRVSCVVGSQSEAALNILQNTFPFSRRPGVRPSKPDDHTLVVQDAGKDVFRIRFSEPRRIEVTGQLFERRSAEPALISFEEGIYWSGGGIPPGTVIDLRGQGRGRIDFGSSGSIRVLSPS